MESIKLIFYILLFSFVYGDIDGERRELDVKRLSVLEIRLSKLIMYLAENPEVNIKTIQKFEEKYKFLKKLKDKLYYRMDQHSNELLLIELEIYLNVLEEDIIKIEEKMKYLTNTTTSQTTDNVTETSTISNNIEERMRREIKRAENLLDRLKDCLLFATKELFKYEHDIETMNKYVTNINKGLAQLVGDNTQHKLEKLLSKLESVMNSAEITVQKIEKNYG